MTESQKILKQIISLMGFNDFSINYSNEANRFSIFISDAPFLDDDELLSKTISNLNFLFKYILKRKGFDVAFVDINNYSKSREDIIVKLAKAAAKKSSTTNKLVELPPMNSFERRIIHSSLSINPEIKTHSEGDGKTRHVVITPLSN